LLSKSRAECYGNKNFLGKSVKPDADKRTLFCFGLGFTGTALANTLLSQGWSVAGTRRGADEVSSETKENCSLLVFDGSCGSDAVVKALHQASHVLVTIPPQKESGDAVLKYFKQTLIDHPGLRWLGYLSTTGVYGDRGGDWVDESSDLCPQWAHQKRRADAEAQWLELNNSYGIPVHVFRLAGIYGPGRNLLERVREGTARRIDVPGLVFNRIHVLDVVQVLTASMARPNPGAVYNVSDDRPAPPAEAVAFACELLQVEVPPLVSLDEAGLSEMGRGFYATNKKVRNRKIKKELGVELRYPDYQAGLRALLKSRKIV